MRPIKRPDIITYRIFERKKKDSYIVLEKHTIQEALGKCQPRQRMWGWSWTVLLGVLLEIEAEKHQQILEPSNLEHKNGECNLSF